MSHPKHLTAGLLACTLISPSAQAVEKPLWEAGMGIAAINFPNYRGSDRRQVFVLPAPYLVYRGDFLQIDRQHARGLLFNNGTVELDISLNGSVPVRTKDNPVRTGMPDLDPTVEIGPSMKIWLSRSEDGKSSLNLRLPVRPVIATNLTRSQGAGVLFHPQLNANIKDALGDGWDLGMMAGPIFADQRYHQFFYGVDPQYATATRPAYSARGGYSGFQFTSSLSKRFPGYWIGGYMKLDDMHGAVFADSPLVKTKQSYTVGLAVSWMFAQSGQKVERPE